MFVDSVRSSETKRVGNFEKGIEQLELHIRLERDLHRNTIDQKVLNLEISYKAEQAKKEADVGCPKAKDLTLYVSQSYRT